MRCETIILGSQQTARPYTRTHLCSIVRRTEYTMIHRRLALESVLVIV